MSRGYKQWCIALAMLCGLITGCAASAVWQKKAAQVRILNALPTTEGYEYLGDVSGTYNHIFGTTASNTRNCRQQMQNRAVALGGEVIVVTSQNIGSAACKNCVDMAGSTYRKRVVPSIQKAP